MSLRSQEDVGTRTSSPSSLSGCLSGDEEDQLPTTLAEEELQLVLNKEATEEELQNAIARCKELVLECEQFSTERKWLVRHLIELRLRLQEFKEAKSDPNHPHNTSIGVYRRTVRGHRLLLQPILKLRFKKYCDHCSGTIWCIVQVWYQCEDCGFCCHYKCLSQIKRECAHIVASEKGTYENEICPEVGLSAQKFRCAECKAIIPVSSSSWSESRRCDYTGLYYCSACHWGSSAVIPARVVHNWDMNKYPVSQASLQLLKITSNKPLINLAKLNPQLFTLVHELNLVRRLRSELNGMRKYLLVCRLAEEGVIQWETSVTPHLIENPDLYSLQDLVDTFSGELPSVLHGLVSMFARHIKEECELCKGRGHICEICSNDQVLFPFESSAYVCASCSAVLHKACFEGRDKCPKCTRIKLKQEKEELEVAEEICD